MLLYPMSSFMDGATLSPTYAMPFLSQWPGNSVMQGSVCVCDCVCICVCTYIHIRTHNFTTRSSGCVILGLCFDTKHSNSSTCFLS